MKIGDGGRSVRCAACSHVWRAEPIPEPVEPEPQAQEYAEDEVDPFVSEERSYTPPPSTTQMPETEKHAGLAAWGAAAGLLVGVLGAAIIFRADMVRVWPKSASAFALVGLETTASGLQIDTGSISARRQIGAEGTGLMVAALVRNPGNSPIIAPFIQVQIRDAQGRLVLQTRGELETAVVGAREVGQFTMWIADAPADGVDVELRLLSGEFPTARPGSFGSHNTAQPAQQSHTGHDDHHGVQDASASDGQNHGQ